MIAELSATGTDSPRSRATATHRDGFEALEGLFAAGRALLGL